MRPPPATRRRGRVLALLLLFATVVAPLGAAAASRALSPVDLIDLEVAYDTLTSDYYQHVGAQRILDGAHTGIVAYLRERGIALPHVPLLRASGRYALDLHAPGRAVGAALVRYGERLDAHELVYRTIAGEAAALGDPYTVFFTPEQERGFYRFLNPGSFGGIGIVVHLDAQTGRVDVDDVIPDGPADRAGVRAGDWISAIDGVPTRGLAGDAVERRLRGALGTAVQITYGRGEAVVATGVSLVRAAVTPPDAVGRMLPQNVAYVRLYSYGANAVKQLDGALRRTEAQGATAIVLDLRGNAGGYRDAAVAITSRFIPPGSVMVVQARSGKRTTLRTSAPRRAQRPLAVLVNGGTASAAEITAGAIQDTKSGVLVGTKTFGKGLVQQMVPLPDGSALKITVERYATAHGRDIDRRGIAPDVTVEEPADAVAGDPARDPQLARALTLLTRPTPAPTR